MRVSLRKAAKALALLLLSALVSLAAGEIAVRVFRLQDSLFVPDPVLNHVHQPGYTGRLKGPEFDTAIKINPLGLRDRKISIDKGIASASWCWAIPSSRASKWKQGRPP